MSKYGRVVGIVRNGRIIKPDKEFILYECASCGARWLPGLAGQNAAIPVCPNCGAVALPGPHQDEPGKAG